MASGVRELERLAVGTSERISDGVEREITSEGHGGDEIGRSDESVGGRVSVVTAGEVTVVGGDDCENATMSVFGKGVERKMGAH